MDSTPPIALDDFLRLVSFIVNCRASEPGFRLERQNSNERVELYTIAAYSVDEAAETRYST